MLNSIKMIAGLLLLVVAFFLQVYTYFAPFEYSGAKFMYDFYHTVYFWKECVATILCAIVGIVLVYWSDLTYD